MVAEAVAVVIFACGDYYGNEALCARSRSREAIETYQKNGRRGIIVRDIDSGVYTYIPDSLNVNKGISFLESD